MTSNIRLLALDLDGTLTNRKKEVSIRNKHCLQQARKQGITLVLASGRPVIGIQHVAEELGFYQQGGYMLAYNGGQIINCATGEHVVDQVLDSSCYSAICEIGTRYPVYPLTYNNFGVVCENDTNPYVKKEAYNNSVSIQKVPCLLDSIKNPVVKFMVVGDPSALREAKKALECILRDRANVFFSEPYFLEIVSPGIEKATSLDCLASKLGISPSEIMACGDGYNDIPMLQYAGVSVAMENAVQEAKECATFIAPSNEDDGVAVAVERFLLK